MFFFSEYSAHSAGRPENPTTPIPLWLSHSKLPFLLSCQTSSCSWCVNTSAGRNIYIFWAMKEMTLLDRHFFRPNVKKQYIVAYRPVAKRWLCKLRPLLGNVRNIFARNNRTGLCNQFLSNGSVNTRLQQWGYCWKRCFLFGPFKVCRIWESKIWSRVPRDSDPRMTALARASSSCKRQTRPLIRESTPQ
jgi:hypothetical protein